MRKEFRAIVPQEGPPDGVVAVGEILRRSVVGTGFSPELHVFRTIHQIDAHSVQYRLPDFIRVVNVVDVLQGHPIGDGDSRGQLGGEAPGIYCSAGAEKFLLKPVKNRKFMLYC